MRSTGKVNLIGLAMILAVCAGAWWVVLFAPVYSDHMDVTDAVGVAVSQYNNRVGEVAVRQALLRACSIIGTHKELDADGEEKIVPGLGVKDEDVNIIVDEKAHKLRITVDYDREVVLTPLKKIRRVHFQAERKGTLIQ